jgi:hypothetical protein
MPGVGEEEEEEEEVVVMILSSEEGVNEEWALEPWLGVKSILT